MDNNTEPKATLEEAAPNETEGLYFSSVLKISDPDTKEILVQTRGDN